jgi:hypothetical protein
MKKLGICLDKLDNTELITSLNELSSGADIVPVVFNTGWISPPVKNNFAILQMMECFGHRGNILTENLTHIQKVIGLPLAKNKFLYITNNEWENKLFRFQDIERLYNHPQIHLIASSDKQAKILENNWKKPILVMEKYNLKQLTQLGEM